MLGRSVALNIAGRAANLGIGMISSIFLARLLGAADRGLLGVMVSVADVTLALTSVGLPMAVMYYASRKDTPRGALFGNSMLYAGVLGLLLVPGVWLASDVIADTFGKGRGGTAWVLAALTVPLTFLNWTMQNQLLGKLRFGLYNVLIAGSKAVTLVAVLVLLGLLDLGVGGALVATSCGPLLTIVGSMRAILRESKPRLDAGVFRSLFRYGASVQVGAIFQAVNFRLDIIVVQFFVALASVGYYLVAQVLAELVITLALAFQSSVLPLVSHYEGRDEQALTTIRSVRHHGILAAAGTLGNAVFGPLLILFGYGPEFHRAIVPFFILLPGMWFLGTGLVVAGDLRGRGRPGLASTTTGAAVAVTLVLDFALIPFFGVVGAAVASLVAYTVYGIVSLVTLSRVAGVPVRELALPTRDDLAVYPRAAGRLRRGLRPQPRAATGEE